MNRRHEARDPCLERRLGAGTLLGLLPALLGACEDANTAVFLEVADDVRFCGAALNAELPETFNNSFELRILPGRYSLGPPREWEEGGPLPPGIEVPLRFEFSNWKGSIFPTVLEMGKGRVIDGYDRNGSPAEGTTWFQLDGLRMQSPDEVPWHIFILRSEPTSGVIHLGPARDAADFAGRRVGMTCGSGDVQSTIPCVVDGHAFPGSVSIEFTDCSMPWAPVRRFTVEFEGGSVAFDQQHEISQPRIREGQGVILEASGTFRGTPFRQTDWRWLGYYPSDRSSHLEPDLGVLFTEPIDGVCGLAAKFVVPEDQVPARRHLYAVDCDLQPISELTIHRVTIEENLPFPG